MSAFALEDGVVYHTYSTYARGLDGLWGHVPVARPRTAATSTTGSDRRDEHQDSRDGSRADCGSRRR
jgi:predicted dithiol-disulfide oxidoreductase (DUF899 family)